MRATTDHLPGPPLDAELVEAVELLETVATVEDVFGGLSPWAVADRLRPRLTGEAGERFDELWGGLGAHQRELVGSLVLGGLLAAVLDAR